MYQTKGALYFEIMYKLQQILEMYNLKQNKNKNI